MKRNTINVLFSIVLVLLLVASLALIGCNEVEFEDEIRPSGSQTETLGDSENESEAEGESETESDTEITFPRDDF